MTDALIQLALFTSKSIILFILILGLLVAFFGLLAKGKQKMTGKLVIKDLNEKYNDMQDQLYSETMPKKEYKKFLKEKKAEEKKRKDRKNIYVIDFDGDIKASAVSALTEEVNAIINVASPKDEVVIRLESPGGMVPGYGLAAAQLARFRSKQIPLTVAIDKVAASGGYMMACTGNKILSAPFAITGSIGVIVQIPNFHRLLKEKHVDYEQLTAGEYKRTLTVFGENTKEGKEKLQEIIETTHQLFKKFITTHRPKVDIEKVATGEHWYGEEALERNLIDEIKTSDDYLLEASRHANVYKIKYMTNLPLITRLTSAAATIWQRVMTGL